MPPRGSWRTALRPQAAEVPPPRADTAVAVAEPPGNAARDSQRLSPPALPPAVRPTQPPAATSRWQRLRRAGSAQRWRGRADHHAGTVAQRASGHRNSAGHDRHAADGGLAGLDRHAPAARRRQHAADAVGHAGCGRRTLLPVPVPPGVLSDLLPRPKKTGAQTRRPFPRRRHSTQSRLAAREAGEVRRRRASGRSPRQPL